MLCIYIHIVFQTGDFIKLTLILYVQHYWNGSYWNNVSTIYLSYTMLCFALHYCSEHDNYTYVRITCIKATLKMVLQHWCSLI